VECEIHLTHATVSRRHAEVWRKAGRLFIRDLSSTNGTYVDGRRVTEVDFSPGQTLHLGEVTLDVVVDPHAHIARGPVDLAKQSTSEGSATVLASAGSGLSCAGLTGSQHQVLRLLLRGRSEKEVAAGLSLSPQTVHTHVKGIYRALGVHSRAELMARFITHPVDVFFAEHCE
jgi:DNA-binding CsgD family transcriptional regulator